MNKRMKYKVKTHTRNEFIYLSLKQGKQGFDEK
jgi:hypothetical protein